MRLYLMFEYVTLDIVIWHEWAELESSDVISWIYYL